MRRDEETLLSFEEDPKGSPLVRLYRWDRLCLSLGHFQREKPNIGLPTVRRPTGGGALLHGWDLSFSLVDSRERWGARPSEIYRRVAGIFIKTFGEIGFEVSLERFRGRYLDSFYCFWVPTLGELSHGGRKVVSLAMRTLRRSF
ncbi:lipoyl protein ligase domain-containing protein, partial [Hydrogenivirga sp.]